MNFPHLTRRRFLAAAALLAPAAAYGDARLVELRWVKIKQLRLSDAPTRRLVHFTDLHHKGDTAILEHVVAEINRLKPELVCFTGDIVEEASFLLPALKILARIQAPLYGIPGNHEYWSNVPFGPIRECFASTGGAWLVDEAYEVPGKNLNLVGVAQMDAKHPVPASKPGVLNLLLLHYPAWVKELGDRKYDLILAGHSHGGQVRIPFYGPIALPFGVDEFDLGLFQTRWGPLYVNPGIGYIYDYNFRFNCRPEITVIEL